MSISDAARAGSGPPSSRLERWAERPATVWLVVLLALGLGCVGLDKGIWLDEASSLHLVAKSSGELWRALREYDHPPAYFLLLHAVASAGGGLRTMRAVGVAIFVATVLVLLLGIRRRNPLAGSFAGLLAATSPALLSTAHDLRPYGLLLLAANGVLVAADEIAERPDSATARFWLTAALVLAVATHALGLLLAAPAAILALARKPRLPRARVAFVALAPAAVLAAVWWLALSSTAPKSAADWWIPAPTFATTARILASWFVPGTALAGASPAVRALALVPVLALLVASTLALLRPRRDLFVPAIAASSYVAVLLTVSLLYLPVFWLRTALPALPFAIAFVALAAAEGVARRRRTTLVLVGSAVVGLALSWVVLDARRSLEAWSPALSDLGVVEHDRRPIVVYPDYVRRILELEPFELDRRAPLRVALGDPPSEDTIERWLAARRVDAASSPVRLVVRIDLSTSKRPGAFRVLARHLAAATTESGLDALLVDSRDALVEPSLVATRHAFAGMLLSAAGSPSDRAEKPDYTLLRFPPRPRMSE